MKAKFLLFFLINFLAVGLSPCDAQTCGSTASNTSLANHCDLTLRRAFILDATFSTVTLQPVFRDAIITVTNTGSGVSTYDNTTGVLNIPQYLTSINSGNVTTALGYTPINPNGTTSQYFRGDGSLATFPINNTAFTNGAGYLTAEVDGSVTNEIELPSQAGNNGRVLGTNGTTASWVIASAGTVTSVGVSSSDFSVSGSPVTSSGSITVNLNNSGVSAGTYTGPYTVNAKGIVTSASNRSFSTASRSLNSTFQVSTTRDVLVSYSVDISTSVSLAGGQVGTVYLEYADDSGFTTGVTEVARFVNGNTGTLVVGLTLNQTNTAPVGGLVPANKYVRLRTQNNTGTPTFTYRSGQEVLM